LHTLFKDVGIGPWLRGFAQNLRALEAQSAVFPLVNVKQDEPYQAPLETASELRNARQISRARE
jgi:hypothetical protein